MNARNDRLQSASMMLQHTVAQPHSVEAEQSVLGGLLLENDAWDRVHDVLTDADFFDVRHRAIFVAMQRLIMAGKPADPITVHDGLQRVGMAGEVGGLAYLNALAQAVPSARNALRYAEIVREHALRRSLLKLAGSLADAALEREDGGKAQAAIQSAVDRHVQDVLALAHSGPSTGEPIEMDVALVRFMDHLNAAFEGEQAIATGLHAIDRKTAGGGRHGELWVVGARPSMGKSASMLSLWINVANKGNGVLFLTQEDSDITLVSRAVANRGRVNLADLRNPAHCQDKDALWAAVGDGVSQLSSKPMMLDDQGGLTLADVRRKVQQARRKLGGNLDLVIVDYLQLMTGEGDNRNQLLGAIANGLKALAKELKVWVVLLSQLNRKADERTGVPQLSDLRDSGDIEGAADTILLLHREAQRNQTLGPDWKHYAQVHIAKQKNGPTCIVPLHFDGAYQRFSDWDGPPPNRPGRGSGSSDGGFD